MRAPVCLGWQGDFLGDGPQEGKPFACDGRHDLISMFTASGQFAVAFTQPCLGFPADILDGFGQFFQTQLEMTADLSRLTVSPGTFDQRPTGVAIARCGDAAPTPPLPTGIFRRA
jgi:hypothetical protein